jgi:RHS repeat-associated protein
LTSATGYEPDGVTLRANENFGYVFDAAGNLMMRTNNTLTQTFNTDGANELTSVTRNNDLLTVAGSMNGSNSFTMNGQAATIYHDQTFVVTNGLTINNGLNTFTAIATSNSVTMTNKLLQVLPNTVNVAYDANGNLVSDGLHGYDYDCANELTRITVTNTLKAEFTYDGFGRRRINKEFAWQTNAWVETNEVHYVYDGMNVIQERDGSNNPKVSYTRGLDLSGGVGGLLARTDTNGSAYYHCDGNGNITMMIDSTGTQKAKYLYDPFGNTLGAWGTLATANTYRFSSKEYEPISGLYYYCFRFYTPNQQRWLNRKRGRFLVL